MQAPIKDPKNHPSPVRFRKILAPTDFSEGAQLDLLDGIERFLIGSVAERVVRTAPCPVLTLKVAPSATAPGHVRGAQAVESMEGMP